VAMAYVITQKGTRTCHAKQWPSPPSELKSTVIGTYDDKHSFLGFQRISVLKGVGHQDSGPGRPRPARGFTRGNRLSGSETWSGKPEPGIQKYLTMQD